MKRHSHDKKLGQVSVLSISGGSQEGQEKPNPLDGQKRKTARRPLVYRFSIT